MSEPFGTPSTLDTATDPALQDAAQGLADQLDGQAPEAAPEPAAAPAGEPAPVTAPAAREPARFGEGLKKFQGGYRGRQQRIREENRRLRTAEERYNEAQAKNNELLQAAVEALKARGTVAPEEEVPDPVLDPAGFQQWLLGKHSSTVNDALKPVVEAIQRQEQRFAQLEQTRAAQAEEQERHQAATQQFLAWERDYQQESPELAAGVRDRYVAGRDLLGRALQAAGVEPEMTQGLAERHLFAIASSADAIGDNGVAAIDGFIYGLYREFYGLVAQDLAQDGIQVPPFEGGAAPGNGAAPAPSASPSVPGNGAPVAPAQSEADRLAAVRARTAAAGNAAPRVADRGVGSAPSKAIQLYRGGVRDPKALRAAALEEANGIASRADEIMAALIAEVAG